MTTSLQQGLATDAPVELAVVGRRNSGRGGRVALLAALIGIAVFFILPLLLVLSASLKFQSEIFTDTGFVPADPGLENYEALFGGNAEFVKWFTNSSIVAIVGTVLVLLLTSLSAYAFARIDFRFKSALTCFGYGRCRDIKVSDILLLSSLYILVLRFITCLLILLLS